MREKRRSLQGLLPSGGRHGLRSGDLQAVHGAAARERFQGVPPAPASQLKSSAIHHVPSSWQGRFGPAGGHAGRRAGGMARGGAPEAPADPPQPSPARPGFIATPYLYCHPSPPGSATTRHGGPAGRAGLCLATPQSRSCRPAPPPRPGQGDQGRRNLHRCSCGAGRGQAPALWTVRMAG